MAQMLFHAHEDEARFVQAACDAVLEAVEEDVQRHADTLLLLSGGSTPIPVYRALAPRLRAMTGGRVRTTVSLVDERWVDPGDPGSNEGMLRQTLGIAADGAADGIRLWPLVAWDAGLQASVASANARLRAARGAVTLAVFGMGDDGHTASLFPQGRDLLRALAAVEPYVAFDARGCPGAGAWPQRITLTPCGWKPARRRLLLIRGAGKRRLLEQAERERDVERLPVSAAIALGDAPLEVHWAP
jgi:6-phosphogluconolactonase